MEGRPAGDRCVVWHPRGVAPDSELLNALNRRGLMVTACDNRCEAFARVCVAKSGAVAPEQAKTILLLSDPERLAGVGEVAGLVERYAPHAICGVFESVGDRRVRAVTPGDTERWARGAKPGVAPGVAPLVTLARHMAARAAATGGRARPADEGSAAAALAAAISGPRLRLTGEGQLPPSSSDQGGDEMPKVGVSGRAGESENPPAGSGKAPAAAPALITDQELAMLLAKDPLPEQD